MRIGVVSDFVCAGACDVLGHPWVELPAPGRATGSAFGADCTERLEVGKAVHVAMQSGSLDLILDRGGGGLTFVSGPGGLEDVRLTHELLGVPLVSHWHDPLTTVFQALPWPLLWTALGRPTWTKAVWDARHADELMRFGASHVVHVPAAAPDVLAKLCGADLPPATKANSRSAVDVAFVGDATPEPVAPPRVSKSIEQQLRQLAIQDRPANDAENFFDLYHTRFAWAPAPTDSDSPEVKLEKAADYFAAKHMYLALRALHRRDRFVVLLKAELGDRFGIIGHGWQERYGLAADPPPVGAEAYVRHYRDVPIHLNLIDANTESALSARPFEVAAAGGFVLGFDHPELRSCLEPTTCCDTFCDEHTLLGRIEHYLSHGNERLTIARAGQRVALDKHLYHHRLQGLLETGIPQPTAPETKRPDKKADHAGLGFRQSSDPTLAVRVRPRAETLLVLVNPGDFTRHYLIEMMQAAQNIGITTQGYELTNVWDRYDAKQAADVLGFKAQLREHNVRAVLSCSYHGSWEWPDGRASDGRARTVFETMNIPHLMWWTDHPLWALTETKLEAILRPTLGSSNCHHFVKSESAARELRDVLGWANCHMMPVAQDPTALKPVQGVEPDYDVVAIVGSTPRLDPAVAPYLEHDDPDESAIVQIVAKGARKRLGEIWGLHAPPALHEALTLLGNAWLDACERLPDRVAHRQFVDLEPEHGDAANWLRGHVEAYFAAVAALWELGHWRRTFILAYLARHFRVGVFGSDWSGVGLAGGPEDRRRVRHVDQPAVYARGRIAINISQGNDEESIAHKPFQIAASKVAMLHRAQPGLAECFRPGVEVETFTSPRDAREKVAALLADPERRASLAAAAHRRLLAEHTWAHRLPQMLSAAGVRFTGVRLPDARCPSEATVEPALAHAP